MKENTFYKSIIDMSDIESSYMYIFHPSCTYNIFAKWGKMKKKLTLRQYYKTQHWIDLHKKWVYTDDTCYQICGCKRYGFYLRGKKKGMRKPKAENHIHIHHKHYNTMFKEEREDVMILCDSCHKLGHMLEDIKGRDDLYKQMYDDFKTKTGWEFKKR